MEARQVLQLLRSLGAVAPPRETSQNVAVKLAVTRGGPAAKSDGPRAFDKG